MGVRLWEQLLSTKALKACSSDLLLTHLTGKRFWQGLQQAQIPAIAMVNLFQMTLVLLLPNGLADVLGVELFEL